MAFIREYSRAHTTDKGDPFSFRIPRRIRKLQAGRALRRVASTALPFAVGALPGGGAALQFARAAGIDVGDPRPMNLKKRKGAASGPKAKAAKKRDVRANRALSGAALAAHNKKAKKGGGFNLGAFAKGAGSAALQAAGHLSALGVSASDVAKIVGGGTDILQQGADALTSPDLPTSPDQLASVMGLPKGSKVHVPGHTGKRRRQNPLNVHALRRSLGRISGFKRIEKRVNKLLARHAPRPHVAHSGKGRKR